MEIATVLLQYGAETNILTKQGVTPLHLASQEGHANMGALLISKGAQINVQTKVPHESPEEVSLDVHSHCCDMNIEALCDVSLLQSGLSALHLAAQEDKVAVGEILAKNGANLDQQTKVGNVAFFQAQRTRSPHGK